MELNRDGTINSLKPDRKGVGQLVKTGHPKPVDISNAMASACSNREPLIVQPCRLPSDVQLSVHLPQDLPVRTHSFNAVNAIDCSNFTKWLATSDTGKWWQVKLYLE